MSELEVEGEVGEGGKLQELLAGGRLIDDLVLENPGEVVGDEDGVKACSEGRIDVGTGAVADHPSVPGFAAVVSGQGKIGFVMLFG